MSVMSLASIATSVPVPIAMPMSAWASAGASLMPSPTMATFLPPACSASTCCAFCSGQHVGDHVVDADLPGDHRGRPAVVAGEHDDLEAELAQPAHGRDRPGLDRVGHGDGAGRLAVDRAR